MRLSVVIPAYNEERDIQGAINDVSKVFPQSEIIIVNDASTDRTLDVISTLGNDKVRVVTNEKNLGHGASVVKGLREASGDYILYIDADRQIEIVDVPLNADVISGWRVNRKDKPFRKVISFCLKMTNLVFHRIYIKDANCPYKIYKRSSLMYLLDMLPRSYIIPIACLEVLARKHELKVATIRTPHKEYDGVRKGFLQAMNLNTVKFFTNAFFEIIRL